MTSNAYTDVTYVVIKFINFISFGRSGTNLLLARKIDIIFLSCKFRKIFKSN